MFLFFQLCHVAFGFITHDEGYCRDFHVPFVSNFPCVNGYSQTATNYFSGTFANPPQVILTIEKLDQTSNSCLNTFTVTTVTTTSFQIYVKCATGRVFTYGIHWYAFDDSRIEVINRFDTTDFTQQIIPHQNPNALVGFVTLLSISYSANINFAIDIVSITSSDVTVQITDPQSLLANLNQISYQIVIGVPEAINILSTVLFKELIIFYLLFKFNSKLQQPIDPSYSKYIFLSCNQWIQLFKDRQYKIKG